MRGRGKLSAIAYVESPETTSEEFPFILVTGRVLEHYNVGTMTRRTPNRELVPEDVLEVNPNDALRERISEGEIVEIESQWGLTSMRVRLSQRVAPRTLFAAFHYPETHTNRLTGSCVDPDSKCPNYKVTAVRLRRKLAG
jgi:predicted molibdopterin-dependent oxidoreductase YjgC